jgi:hypothetical protein
MERKLTQERHITLPRHANGLNISGLRFYSPIEAVIDGILADLDQLYGKGNFRLFWGTSGKQLR